jgi:hypothetical protein
MTTENLARKTLTCGACVISGFILAMWCMPLLDSKPRVSSAKQGFSITVPLTQLKRMTDSETMRGKSIRFLRASGVESEACVIEHSPLTLATHENFAIFSGPIESMENTSLAVSVADLRSIQFIEAGTASGIRSCRQHPKVTYGE